MKRICLLLLVFLSLGCGAALAGPCPVKLPVSRGTGTTPGVPVAGGTQYYFADALLEDFDCFEQLSSWFPSYITTQAALDPAKLVVDMAYAEEASATFKNVVVPATGMYSVTIRYAYEGGLFPTAKNRPEGIRVNGVVITTDMPFPITGSFETFQDSTLVVPLNAGVNTIQMFNISSVSLSRVDSMTITPGGSNSCGIPPGVPGTLTAKVQSSAEIDLKWGASTPPLGCAIDSYNVFRSTTPNFVPSGSNEIAAGVATLTYNDTTALCSTTYYYLVQATDFAGQSMASNQATATTNVCPTSGSVQINAGGPIDGPFLADIDFAGGGTLNHANTIDLSGVTSAAPMTVYQTARTKNFSYTVSGFSPSSLHLIRLHFAETYFTTPGSRTFNVSINGAQVLSNFDIVAAAGAKNRAIIKEFTQNASSTGDFVITFTSVVNDSLVSGIEVQ